MLRTALKSAIGVSFNRISVDGDTSTNDVVAVMANGASGLKPGSRAFEAALTEVLESLAKQIARDGEGARKLVTIDVEGDGDGSRGGKNRALDREFAPGEDGDRGIGSELGHEFCRRRGIRA